MRTIDRRSAGGEVRAGSRPVTSALTQLRRTYNAFIARHEVAWELSMAALAIVYVVIGLAADAAQRSVAERLDAVDTAITVVFIFEFASRLIAAESRSAYLRGHWIDVIALLPAIRELRALRLLRFLRLVRAVAGIYRALGVPVLRRVLWHLERVLNHIDARTSLVLAAGLAAIVLLAALAVTWIEGPLTFQQLGEAVYWAITTLLGSGDASFVSSLAGRLISAALIVGSLTFLAVLTGIVIGFIIDIVIREGQGMGVAGHAGHIIVCGWNETATEVVSELNADGRERRVVLLAKLERNPVGSLAHFVRGDPMVEDDLERAGIREAASAIVFPDHAGDDADMRSIVIVMAIKQIAPTVRTVVEASSPANVAHLKRAGADEVIATPQFVAHLLARSSMHPGLVDLVMDMVSGGEGSELYRVALPAELVALPADAAGPALRRDHNAVLLAVIRNGQKIVNPPADLVLEAGDELVILAETLRGLEPARAS